MRDTFESPEFQRLYDEYFRAEDALHASRPPFRVTREIDEPVAEFKLTPDQLEKIRQATERFERAREALNDHCRARGEPECF